MIYARGLTYLCELCLIAEEEERTNTILGIIVIMVHDEAIAVPSVSSLLLTCG